MSFQKKEEKKFMKILRKRINIYLNFGKQFIELPVSVLEEDLRWYSFICT